MAKKGSFSKVYDKNGDYVDVEAARFDGTRTFQMQGDVSATQTWNGDSASALTLNTSIGAKKVTTDKINDKAVQTGQIDDGAVGLTQIATNAMNGTVQDNDSKLATHAAVKTYVDSQISGQGTYLGKHTVAEINAMVTDNLHNGDRVMTSDSGTINLGPGGVGFDVEAGEDLILYKSGSTVQWDSMDGNFKTKQTAVSDPTASGTGLTFIDSASQDENGEMTLSKKTVQDGTTSQKGVVQLEDSHSSTSTTKAATPKNVKEAYDLASTANSGLANKQDKPSSATENNIATFNGSKSTKDSGKAFLPSTSTWDGTSDDKVPTAKAVQAQLDLKADADKVLYVCDAYVSRGNITTMGWYKLAERQFDNTFTNNNSIFNLYCGTYENKFFGTLKICIRSEGTGSAPVLKSLALYSESGWNTTEFPLKFVTRGLAGSLKLEVWVGISDKYRGVWLTEANTTSSNGSAAKRWTYFSDTTTAGGEEPVDDATNNVKTTAIPVYVDQHNVTSATAGNFAGLDANGLLTDSGKKAADFELVANKVTSVRAASSATDTAYPSEKAVRIELDKKANSTNYTTAVGAKGLQLRFLNTANLYDGVFITILNGYGGIGYRNITFAVRRTSGGTPSVHRYNTEVSSNDYPTGENFSVYYGTDPSDENYRILLIVPGGSIQGLLNRSTAGTASTWSVLYDTPTTTGLTQITPIEHTNVFGANKGSASVPVYVDASGAATPCTDDFEHTTNKVSSWQSTPDDTHYPSEKLVKDGLDAKADANNAVTIYDSYVCRININGNYWYKIAEVPFKNGLQFRNAVWDVYANVNNSRGVYKGTLVMKTGSDSSSVAFRYARLYTDDWDSNVFGFKIVVKTTFSNGYVQLWAKLNSNISSLSISERFMFANTYKPSKKSPFTYTSYDSVAGEVEPQTDATNNITANPVNVVYRQHAIASPTNNNLVAMDASGLVKDSGLTKSSVESAISSAGSAIQGVKVNNTTLTPDANKVVTVPLATTSADGAMSAADKTALEGKVTGPSSATTDDIAVFDGATGKIVKDGGKKLSDIVKYYDANVYRYNSNSGDGWFKIAEKTITEINSNVVGVWRVVNTTIGGVNEYTLECNVRAGSSGSNLIKYKFRIDGCDSFVETVRTFKLVTRGKAGGSSSIVELWCYLAKDFVDVAISALHVGGLQTTNSASWTYYSGHGGGTSLPTADPSSDVNVYDLDFKISKHTQTAVTDPTASGTALSFIDSITQNENGEITATKKTVSDATTSEHGLMSATDKTKLNGIAEGAEVNVQADWNETSSSSDAFIKNKPYYEKSLGATGKIFKVFSSPKLTSGNKDCYGIELFYRAGYGGIYGNLLFKDVFILQQTKIGNVQAWQTLKFYVSVGTDTVTVYAKNDDGYCTLCAAPLANLPKANVDFTDFGTEVSSLPEGATEITPVWVANSASSSGTAPVKVDAYGALTAVPMDSTPTASSTNLMTSGDIKTALDEKAPIASPALTGTPTAPTASSGTNTTQIATTAFVQSAVDAQKYGSPVNFYGIKITKKITNNVYDYVAFSVSDGFYGKPGKVSVGLRLPAGTSSNPIASGSLYNRFADGAPNSNYGTSLTRIYYKIVDANIEFYILNSTGNANRYGVIENLTPSVVPVTFSVLTSSVDVTSLTELTWTSNKKGVAIPTAGTAVGSAAIPVYVNESGDAVQCTDDFVHDGDLTTALATKADKATGLTGATKCKITYNSDGIVTAGDDLENTDLPKFFYNAGCYDTFASNSYNSDAPYGKIAELVVSTAANRHIRQNFVLVNAGGSKFEFRLSGSVSSTSTSSNLKVAPISSKGNSFSVIKNYLYVRQSFTPNSSSGLVISIYVRFTGNWQYIRLYQILGPSGDSGSVEVVPFYMYTKTHGEDTVGTLPNDAVPWDDNPSNNWVGTADRATSDKNGNDIVATYVSDVSYVAAQSGGGGDLKKTINGSSSSVLAFMTTAEAHSLWTNAKANAS